MALVVLLVASTAAFTTSITHTHHHHSTTSHNAWKKSVQDRRKAAQKPKPKMPRAIQEFGDPNSDQMKNLVDIVGMTRIKKAARKQKRVRNQMIREGLIELNEDGVWIKKK